MDVLRPLANGRQLQDDWLRVTHWMDEAEHDADDLDTLGTDDPRRRLRPAR
jgi:hypothetical protein